MISIVLVGYRKQIRRYRPSTQARIHHRGIQGAVYVDHTYYMREYHCGNDHQIILLTRPSALVLMMTSEILHMNYHDENMRRMDSMVLYDVTTNGNYNSISYYFVKVGKRLIFESNKGNTNIHDRYGLPTKTKPKLNEIKGIL